MIKNFWKMRGFNLFTVPYAYVDHCSYQADSLLVQRKVKVKYQKEMIGENSAYCIIFCKVLKSDTQRFEEALEKLKDKMILLGYRNYAKKCEEVTQMIEEGMKVRKEN